MATPHEFFNPFFSLPQVGAGWGDGSRGGFIDDTPTNAILQLPVTGQGTISVESAAEDSLSFAVKAVGKQGPTLYLHIDTKGAKFCYKKPGSTGDYIEIKALAPQGLGACALNYRARGKAPVYWLSIDHNNGILRYGKSYTNASMTLLEAQLKFENKNHGIWEWKDSGYAWLKTVKTVKITQGPHNMSEATYKDIKISPLPVVLDRSPYIKPSEEITLSDLEKGCFTAPANLPKSCQHLYNNIYGVKLEDGKDGKFPFAATIQYSCITPGCWAHQVLQKKAHGGEFGPDPNGTYLRITLGSNLGDSPGVPYVMEIWPAKHYSPIHDHGNACAVIKVLHGEIQATYYSGLLEPRQQLGNTAKFEKGAITWLGEQNYQIHKLHNTSDDVCVTIQCYRYEDNQNTHDDVFRFEKNNQIEDFTPNSDFTFGEFREQMLEEWDAHREAIQKMIEDMEMKKKSPTSS